MRSIVEEYLNKLLILDGDGDGDGCGCFGIIGLFLVIALLYSNFDALLEFTIRATKMLFMAHWNTAFVNTSLGLALVIAVASGAIYLCRYSVDDPADHIGVGLGLFSFLLSLLLLVVIVILAFSNIGHWSFKKGGELPDVVNWLVLRGSICWGGLALVCLLGRIKGLPRCGARCIAIVALFVVISLPCVRFDALLEFPTMLFVAHWNTAFVNTSLGFALVIAVASLVFCLRREIFWGAGVSLCLSLLLPVVILVLTFSNFGHWSFENGGELPGGVSLWVLRSSLYWVIIIALTGFLRYINGLPR